MPTLQTLLNWIAALMAGAVTAAFAFTFLGLGVLT